MAYDTDPHNNPSLVGGGAAPLPDLFTVDSYIHRNVELNAELRTDRQSGTCRTGEHHDNQSFYLPDFSAL